MLIFAKMAQIISNVLKQTIFKHPAPSEPHIFSSTSCQNMVFFWNADLAFIFSNFLRLCAKIIDFGPPLEPDGRPNDTQNHPSGATIPKIREDLASKGRSWNRLAPQRPPKAPPGVIFIDLS